MPTPPGPSKEEKAAQVALTSYLTEATGYQYSTATNWLDIEKLIVSDKEVTGDFSIEEDTDVANGIQAIYSGLSIDENGKVNGTGGLKDAKDYAIDSYVMNTFARYLGALYRQDTGETVKKIKFNGIEYNWNGNAQGSNWKSSNGSTLVSAVVNQQNTSLRNVTITLIDNKGYSINTTFKAINVPTKEQISAQ